MQGNQKSDNSAPYCFHLPFRHLQGPKKWFSTKEGPRQDQAIFSGSVVSFSQFSGEWREHLTFPRALCVTVVLIRLHDLSQSLFGVKSPPKKATLPSFASFLSPLLLHPPFLPPRLRGRTQNAEPMSKRISSHLKKPKSRSPSPLPFPPDQFVALSAVVDRASE